MHYDIDFAKYGEDEKEQKAIDALIKWNPRFAIEMVKIINANLNKAKESNSLIVTPPGLRQTYFRLFHLIGVQGYPVRVFYARMLRLFREYNRSVWESRRYKES